MPASEIKKEAREALRGKWGKAVCIVLVYLALSFIIGFIGGLAGEGTLLYEIIRLFSSIISVPLSFGLIISFMKLKRDEKISRFDFFKDGFSRFARSWKIALHTFVRLLLPIICLVLIVILMIGLTVFIKASNSASIASPINPILLIVSVILFIATIVYVISRSLLYAIAYNIGYDNPELSAKACVLKSAALMKGNRGNYFLLQLSFIGWSILPVLASGICAFGLQKNTNILFFIITWVALLLVFEVIVSLWLFPYVQVANVCFYERIAKPEGKKVKEEIKIEE